jgi:superfamily II DNA or RNA helicase
MEEIMVTDLRTQKQTEVIRSWNNVGGKGTLQAATAFGKTRVALRIAQWIANIITNSRILIIVPSNYLLNQWLERLAERGINAEVMTVQTFIRKYSEENPWEGDLLILDEIHRYTAPQFGKVFVHTKYKYILGLSATLSKSRLTVINKYAPVFATITIEECLKNNWVSNFTIFKIGVMLPVEERRQYKELEKQFSGVFSKFGFNFDLAHECFKNKDARERYAREINLTEGQVMGLALKWFNLMRAKNDYLYSAKVKLLASVEIIKHYKNELIIAFGQNIAGAENLKKLLLEENISCEAYHSKMSGGKKVKDQIISDFAENKINVLSTAVALDEGADIPDIGVAIIYGRTSQNRQNIQRIGRAIRWVENKETKIFQIYVKDSQDEKWLESSLKGIPKDRIISITLDDL